jgi:uncharacterized membrane protein YphA (DoxX/SURF4 family)
LFNDGSDAKLEVDNSAAGVEMLTPVPPEVESYVGEASRFLVGGVFAVAAAAKIGRIASFQRTLRELGSPAPKQIAVVVVCLEGVTAVMFVGGFFKLAASLLASLLLGGFVVASLIVISEGRTVPCNCFGSDSSSLGLSTAGRSILLLLPVASYMLSTGAAAEPWSFPLQRWLVITTLSAGMLLLGRWL